MQISTAMYRLSNTKLWFFFFLYTLSISSLIQIVILPYLLPGLHAGNGLFSCSLDSTGFHKLAVELANKISLQGWSAWQLRPGGQSPAGIAAISYFFVLPDPRTLIPLSAAFHASAALILVNLMSLFVKNKLRAILCVLPFFIFPSNLQWTAQWHRDGISILGVVMILQGMVSLFRLEDYNAEGRFFINLPSVIYFSSGFALVSIMRPYILTVIFPFVLFLFAVMVLIFFVKASTKKISWQNMVKVLFSTLFIVFIITKIDIYLCPADHSEPAISIPAASDKPLIKQVMLSSSAKTIKLLCEEVHENQWRGVSFLPMVIENKLYQLAQYRKGFCCASPEASSNIDQDVEFRSTKDVLAYIPRAAQIAFLAPFPSQWLCKGTYRVSSFMRKMSACEMLIIYFTLLFLPFALWLWRKRAEMWTIFLFCAYMMLAHGLVVSNVGSLYRMRYVYIMVLVALGIAGCMVFIDNVRARKDKIK